GAAALPLVVEILVFGAGLEAERQIGIPRPVQGHVLQRVPEVGAVGGIPQEAVVGVGLIDGSQRGPGRIWWRSGWHRRRRLGQWRRRQHRYRQEREETASDQSAVWCNRGQLEPTGSISGVRAPGRAARQP